MSEAPSRTWRQQLFRFRGGIMFLFAGVTLTLAQPTLQTFAAGLCLGLLGEGIRIWAIGYAGEPTRKEQLDAPQLITAGPYALVRNPLYLGNVLNGLGVTIAAGAGPLLWFFNLAGLAGLYGTLVRVEQEFLQAQFGEEYSEYCARVPALWPRFGGRPRPGGGDHNGNGIFRAGTVLRYECSSLIWWLLSWGWLAWRLYE